MICTLYPNCTGCPNFPFLIGRASGSAKLIDDTVGDPVPGGRRPTLADDGPEILERLFDLGYAARQRTWSSTGICSCVASTNRATARPCASPSRANSSVIRRTSATASPVRRFKTFPISRIRRLTLRARSRMGRAPHPSRRKGVAPCGSPGGCHPPGDRNRSGDGYRLRRRWNRCEIGARERFSPCGAGPRTPQLMARMPSGPSRRRQYVNVEGRGSASATPK